MGGYLTTVRNGDIEYFYFGENEPSRKLIRTTLKLKDGTYQTNFFDSETNKYSKTMHDTSFRNTFQNNQYYPNIQRSVIHSKRHDYKNGTLILFNEDKISHKYTLVNNIKDGPYEIYKNGKLAESGIIRNDIKDGVTTEYLGDVKTETMYQSGIKNGDCKKYQNGKLVQTIKYVYGNETEVIDHSKLEEEEKQREKQSEINKIVEEMNPVMTLPSAPPYTEEGVDVANNDAVKQSRGRPRLKKEVVDA